MHLVLFDVDGTLVDSAHLICATMDRAFATLGLPAPPHAATRAIVGLSLPQAMADLAPDLSEADRARLVAAYKDGFTLERDAAPATLYPGIAALLDGLAARDDLLLGVATGKSRKGLDHLIAAHGWERLFLTRQTADTNPSKPHPCMIHAALAETGAQAARTLMVGDTRFDMQMAVAAGVRGLGVGWGYHAADTLAGAGAARVLGDAAALGAAIEEMTA